MKKRWFLLIGFFIGVVFTIILSFIITYDFSSDISEESKQIVESELEIIENCRNMSLEDSAECLVSAIKPFYIYNVTDDKIKLNISQLKERGGDCRNWAFLYQRLGKDLGFNTTTVKNGGVKGLYNAHRYAVIWDGSGSYCKLDMINKVKCYEIKNDR